MFDVDVQERFFAKVDKQGGFPDFDDDLVRVTVDNGQCWVWLGASSGKGYGRVRVHRKLYMAHRLSLMLIGVVIPDDMDVDHLCRRASCVNPKHLEVVTRSENTRRGRLRLPRPHRETCSHGHPLTQENTIVRREGWRACKTCQLKCNREWMRDYRKRQTVKEKGE